MWWCQEAQWKLPKHKMCVLWLPKVWHATRTADWDELPCSSIAVAPRQPDEPIQSARRAWITLKCWPSGAILAKLLEHHECPLQGRHESPASVTGHNRKAAHECFCMDLSPHSLPQVGTLYLSISALYDLWVKKGGSQNTSGAVFGPFQSSLPPTPNLWCEHSENHLSRILGGKMHFPVLPCWESQVCKGGKQRRATCRCSRDCGCILSSVPFSPENGCRFLGEKIVAVAAGNI